MKYSLFALIVVAVIVLAYGMYQYIRVSSLVRKGRDLSSNAVSYDRHGEYPLSFLVVGDSTAVGVGASATTSVPAYLAEIFNASIENHAKSGARLKDIRNQISNVEQKRYDFVLIQGGANDVMFGSSYQRIRNETDLILKEANRLSSHVIFLTAGDIGEAPLWPWPVDWYMTHRTKKVRSDIMRKVNEHNSLYVDLYSLPTPFKEHPQRYYASDFLHLSSEGYAVWAALIHSEILDFWADVHDR